MSSRPEIQAELLANLTEKTPDRLRRKLDKHPQAALDWNWLTREASWSIETENEQVQLHPEKNAITSLEQIRCSCLLSPRCYHVLAVLSVLKLASESESASEPAQETPQAIEDKPTDLSPEQIAAAESIWAAGAAILSAGSRAAGALLQSQILRAIHACRGAGLHRLSSAGLRVVENIRRLREDDEAFQTEELTADLLEMLRVARIISQNNSPATLEILGRARRTFSPLNSLRLTGLFSEPVLTTSGYAGVATYLLGDDGRLYSVSNVRPGTADRVQQAYQTGADLGGLSISHRDLGRQAVLIQKGTRSRDGRLGSGKDCRAAAVDSAGWASETVAKRFRQKLRKQIEDVFQWNALPEMERPAGWDLLFLEGTVLGCDDSGLFLQVLDQSVVLRIGIARDHPALPDRENLELLARIPDLESRWIVRLMTRSPGQVSALAVGPRGAFDEESHWQLPGDWEGRSNLGLDRLKRGHFQVAEPQPRRIEPAPKPRSAADGLEALRRRLRGIAIGGRHAVPTGQLVKTIQESGQLAGNLQPSAGQLIRSLAQSAVADRTDQTGVRFPADPSDLAERWLAAAIYEDAARRHFQKWNWLKGLKD